MAVCQWCGKVSKLYVARTGFSVYKVCRECSEKWEASDKTIEALRELNP